MRLFWNDDIDCSMWELLKWNIGAVFILIGLLVME